MRGQHGFRRGYSCLDQLLQLHTALLKGCKYKKWRARRDLNQDEDWQPEDEPVGGIEQHAVPVAFLDIEAAFDRVWHSAILHKLAQLLPRETWLWHWVDEFLRDRVITVVHGNWTSEEWLLSAGVPQGSVISPCLFLVFMNDLPQRDSQWYLHVFADDIAVRPCGTNKTAEGHLRSALAAISEWADRWHVRFGRSKSKYVYFYKQRAFTNKPGSFPLQLTGFTVDREECYKYLGVILHETLRWDAHVNQLIPRLHHSGRQIARLCDRTRPPGLRTIRALTRAIPYAQAAYGMPVWQPTTKDQQRRLNSALITPIRSALALPHSAHVLSMFVEADLEDVAALADAAALKACLRALALPEEHPTHVLITESLESFDDDRDVSTETHTRFVGHKVRDAERRLGTDLDDPSLNNATVAFLARRDTFERWKAQDKGKRVQEVRSRPGLARYHSLDPPGIAALRSRLRFDLELLGASMLKRHLENNGDCVCEGWDAEQNCKVVESRDHFLLHCPLYAAARQRCLADLHDHSIEPTAALFMGSTNNLTRRDAIVAARITRTFLSSAWRTRWGKVTNNADGPAGGRVAGRGAFARDRNFRVAD